jgi:tetratricopeptide (TPR) repeat protein
VPPESPRIAELRRRVEADPSSIAFAQLAEEYRRAGNYEAAEQTCRTGLARHPGYLSARVTLGRTLIERGDLDGAQAELQFVLNGAPDNLAAIRGIADIFQRRGDLVKALEFYRRALPLARQDPELEELVSRIDRDLRAAKPAAPAAGLSFEQAQSEMLAALSRLPDVAPSPAAPGAERKIVHPVEFPAPVAPPAEHQPPNPWPVDQAPPAVDAHGMDFDSLLQSLGAPDHPAPPTIEALLTPPAALAGVEPILPELPIIAPEDDRLTVLEENLRRPPPVAQEPVATFGETSPPSLAAEPVASFGETSPPSLGRDQSASYFEPPAPAEDPFARFAEPPALAHAGDTYGESASLGHDPFARFDEPSANEHDPVARLNEASLTSSAPDPFARFSDPPSLAPDRFASFGETSPPSLAPDRFARFGPPSLAQEPVASFDETSPPSLAQEPVASFGPPSLAPDPHASFGEASETSETSPPLVAEEPLATFGSPPVAEEPAATYDEGGGSLAEGTVATYGEPVPAVLVPDHVASVVPPSVAQEPEATFGPPSLAPEHPASFGEASETIAPSVTDEPLATDPFSNFAGPGPPPVAGETVATDPFSSFAAPAPLSVASDPFATFVENPAALASDDAASLGPAAVAEQPLATLSGSSPPAVAPEPLTTVDTPSLVPKHAASFDEVSPTRLPAVADPPIAALSDAPTAPVAQPSRAPQAEASPIASAATKVAADAPAPQPQAPPHTKKNVLDELEAWLAAIKK